MASKNACRVFLVAVNVAILALVISQLIIDVKRYQLVDRNVSQLLHEAIRYGNPKVQNIVAIVIGCLAIATAVCGLFGATLWMGKCMLRLFVGLLVLDILCCLALIGILSYTTGNARSAAIESMKKSFPVYGKDNAFTEEIDNFMTKNPCCGWSESDNENLFLLSEWHQKLGKRQTLPNSCCVAANEIRCTGAASIAEARTVKVIHQDNCLKLYTKVAIRLLIIYTVISWIILILDAVSIYAACVLMKLDE